MPASSQSILVLSPHPDDETFGCGGTIRLLTEAGAKVDVVYMTRGELGSESAVTPTREARQLLAGIRTEEAQQACQILGVRHVTFLSGADGALTERLDLSDEIHRNLTGERYSRVFCPWPGEKHPDHAATFQILRHALQRYGLPILVWLYEVWTPLQPNTCVPIDLTMDAKIAAIQAHQSQLKCLDYLSAFRGLAAYRSLSVPGSCYAEAFIAGDATSVLQQ